jgi:CubicO group peptidase (beta-lactamase class C family)
LRDWPEGSTVAVSRFADADVEPLYQEGDALIERPWASVTKVAAAFGVARGVAAHEVDLDEPAGPEGATLRDLLAHCSGLGLEAGDPCAPPRTRRIYSNIGFDVAIARASVGLTTSEWFERHCSGPLGLTRTRLQGRAAAGASGSLNDLHLVALGWATSRGLDPVIRDGFIRVHLADLVGVVPGFGRFEPCPWGLGLEIHGDKHHWMGELAAPESYGHFGQSGSLALIEPDRSLVITALAGSPFGPWARELWPRWLDEVIARFES